MNIRGVDLNLLPILHAVLEEAHVSRAAVRLGLSQPATSSALERCRHLFGDPLLERAGRSMRLTPRAEALREPLAAAMKQIGDLLNVEATPLAEVRQRVHIVMADALGTFLGPRLIEAVGAAAPGVGLVFHPWRGGRAALGAITRGSIDLAVSVLPPADGGTVHVEPVMEERYVVVMREDHPAAADFTLDAWLAWPHLVVSAEGALQTSIDDALAAIGRKRLVGVVAPSFLLGPDLVRESDMIALVPALCVTGRAGRGLAVFSPPLALEGFTISLAWHQRRQGDQAVQFVAGKVRRLLSVT